MTALGQLRRQHDGRRFGRGFGGRDIRQFPFGRSRQQFGRRRRRRDDGDDGGFDGRWDATGVTASFDTGTILVVAPTAAGAAALVGQIHQFR